MTHVYPLGYLARKGKGRCLRAHEADEIDGQLAPGPGVAMRGRTPWSINAGQSFAVDYLLTWNFRHLANAETKPLVREVCEQQGYASPEICTPSELMGGAEDA